MFVHTNSVLENGVRVLSVTERCRTQELAHDQCLVSDLAGGPGTSSP